MLTEQKLTLILSRVEEHPNPVYSLQQTSISPATAASVLWLAHSNKDIKNKVVYDLGCGTGRFAIGAALLGAKKIVGVDIDKEAIDVAKENVKHIEEKTGRSIRRVCHWVRSDIKKLKARCDTVVQYPPFLGVEKDIDIIFLRKALEIARNIYSVHSSSEKVEKEMEQWIKEHRAKAKKMEFIYKITWEKMDGMHRVFLVIGRS
jgi:putative methylase